MALLLVIATSRTNADSVKDQRGCYKRGDIVEVWDDTAHNGDLVANPIAAPFVLVRVAGVTKAQVVRLMQPETTAGLDSHGQAAVIVTRRRQYRVRVDDVPAGILNALQADRYVGVTWAQIKGYIRDKVTGLDEP